MTTFPAFSKLTVIKLAAMDWTCPIPQSGRAGLTTSSPGSKKVFRTCIFLDPQTGVGAACHASDSAYPAIQPNSLRQFRHESA